MFRLHSASTCNGTAAFSALYLLVSLRHVCFSASHDTQNYMSCGVAKPMGCVHAVEGSNPNRDLLFTCKDRTMYEFVENSSRRAVNEIN